MKFTLPKLPYDSSALSPTISQHQFELHYLGHLKSYIDKLNQLPEVASSAKITLEELIIKGKHDHDDSRIGVLPPGPHASTLYNLSSQVYNHTFFFKCLKPKGGGKPNGDIAEIINSQFGSYEQVRKKLIAKGNNLFGSGWIWVTVDDEGELSIIKGLNAETPFVYRGLALGMSSSRISLMTRSVPSSSGKFFWSTWICSGLPSCWLSNSILLQCSSNPM